MKSILINREYDVSGTWYKTLEFLNNFKSVVASDFIDTTSSSGNWSGYIIQKIKNNYYLTLFSQENTNSGFRIYTDRSYLNLGYVKNLHTFLNSNTFHEIIEEKYRYGW